MPAKNKEEKIDIKEVYGKVCISSVDDFLENENVLKDGLTSKQVLERQTKYGKNQIKEAKPKKWYNYLWQSFTSPFNLILLGISIVLIYIDVILQETPNYANLIVVISLIFISTFLEFFEVFKSNKAAEKLKNLVAVKTTVLRDGKEQKVFLDEITVGDVVILSAGEIIPADLRIIEQKDLYVVQSSLTGESDSVKKLSETENKNIDKIEDITDLDTICFMGTNVMSGTGKGVVFKIADDTYFGKVAKTLGQGKPKTNFQKGMESVSKLLIRFMIVLIPVTFLINAFKHDTLTAFTFAVAIAIGITPLLLPVILSSSLAKGAVNMSKKKTIVKRLDSIQSFGAMNILCTDKTGTLTEDKIVLEKYLNLLGQEDRQVLETAFLNSYFQTGLKGNIDEAVINRVKEYNLQEVASLYKKVDEIPFDFSRRRLSVILQKKQEKYMDKKSEESKEVLKNIENEESQEIIMITKGAVEEILSICTYAEENDKIVPITSEIRQKAKKMTKELNEGGLRVIAICKKNINLKDARIQYKQGNENKEEGIIDDKQYKKIVNFTKDNEEKMTLIRVCRFFRSAKEKCKR